MVNRRQNRRRVAAGIAEAAPHVFDAQREPEVLGSAGGIKQNRPDRVEARGGQTAAVGQAGAGIVTAHVAPAGEQPHARAADGHGEIHCGCQLVQVLAPAGQRREVVGIGVRQPQGLERRRKHHGRGKSRALQGIADSRMCFGVGSFDRYAPHRVQLEGRHAVRDGERHGLVEVVADLVGHEAVGERVVGHGGRPRVSLDRTARPECSRTGRDPPNRWQVSHRQA